MLLYHGLFGSLLSYGIIVWGLTYPSLIEKIYIIQKKVVRVITFNSKTAFSTPIFDKLQVLKQEHIFQLQLSSFVYECIFLIFLLYIFQTISTKYSIYIKYQLDRLLEEICLLNIVARLSMEYVLFNILELAFGMICLF